MKLRFNNRGIADSCTFIAYFLIIISCALGILTIADVVFKWDILSGIMQKFAYLIIGANVLIIISSFLISLMVNMNIISNRLENIADKLNAKESNE